MKIVFSFDDGRIDFIDSSKILSKYGLVGTFHITTGFVDGSFETDAFGIGRKALTIQQLQEMDKEGMEISSHGDKHIMDTKDFNESLRKLKEWNLVKNGVGFSIPNSKYSMEELEKFISENKESLLYVRGGRSPKCYTLLSKINYVLYKFLKLQCAYNYFNKYNLNDSLDVDKVIYSTVITKNIKSKNLINFINKHKQENKVLVLMFHSVVDNPSNKWEYSKTEFEKICEYVSSCKDIENGTLSSLLLQYLLN